MYKNAPQLGADVGILAAPCPLLLGQMWFSNRSASGLHFVSQKPRLSLIEMLWGCIGKVANPLPKPLGPFVLSNGTQKRKLLRCGSEVIRSFPHFHPFFSKKRHARPLPTKHGHLSKKLLLQTPLFKTILCKLGMWGHPYLKSLIFPLWAFSRSRYIKSD